VFLAAKIEVIVLPSKMLVAGGLRIFYMHTNITTALTYVERKRVAIQSVGENEVYGGDNAEQPG
jgi:hypothetical protein